MTYEYSYYLFDVGVAYKEDSDRVIAVLKEWCSNHGGGPVPEAILDPGNFGVDKFDDSAVVIKARSRPACQTMACGREMNG